MPGSRIVVEVTGESAGLQGTVDKSVVALKKLAAEANAAAKQASAAGEKTTAANKQVAASFLGVARDAEAQAKALEGSYARQVRAGTTAMNAAARVAAAQDAAAVATEDAAKKSALAVEAKAVRQEQAAAIEVRALETVTRATLEQARVVTQTLREETAALERRAASAKVADATIVSSHAKTAAAAGAGTAAVARAGKTATTAILATAAASVYAATKYEKATTQFITQAGASEKLTKALSKGILDMAGAVGQTPNELAKGMYHVVSALNPLIPASQRATAELGILREAAKGAAIGGASLNDTTYALSSAMNALSLTTIPQASKTMAELNAIAGSGDMHMQDLESAMSTGILPAAKTFGVSLQSVGAALAYMTDTGVPAQMAATRLRMSLSLLGAPSGKAAGLLQTIGLSSKEATARTKAMSDALLAAGLHTTQISADIRRPDGIMVALEDLKKHFESAGVSASAQGAFISAAFGGGRSGSAIMALFNNLDKLQGKYQQIGQTAGSYNKDWSRTQTTLNFQLAQAKGEIESIGVTFGTILIPWVEKGLSGIKDFAHWLDQNRVAADALGVAIGTLATVAIGTFLFNEVKKVGTLMRGFGQILTAGKLGGGIFAGGAGGATGGASGGLMIGGARTGGVLPGSIANPIAVVMESAAQVPGMAGKAVAGDVAAAEGATASRLATVAGTAVRFATAAGAAITALEVASALIPDNRTARGLPTPGAGVAGAATASLHDTTSYLNQTGSDLLAGNAGGALSSAGSLIQTELQSPIAKLIPGASQVGDLLGQVFGDTSAQHVRSFGAEITKLGTNLAALSPAQLTTVRTEAEKLASDPAYARWKSQLQQIALAYDPLTVAFGRVKSQFADMASYSGKSLHDILLASQVNMVQIENTLGSGSQAGRLAVSHNFQLAAADIQASMQAGVVSTQAGTQQILKLLAQALTTVGVPNAPGANLLGTLQNPQQYVSNVTSGNLAPLLNQAGAHATGGWIGQPGEKGRDEVPIVVGRGEAVLNHTQQKIVNAGLARAGMAGGLAQVFAGTSGSLHYMASGGFAGRVVTASEFGGPADPGSSGSTASGKINGPGLVGWAELSNPPGSLNFSALGHLPMGTMLPITSHGRTITAPKVDVGAGGPGLNGHLRAIDLTYGLAKEFGWGPSDLEDVIIGNPAGISLGAAGSGTAGTAGLVAQIPRVLAKGVSGAVGAIAQGALDKIRTAANARLASITPASSGAAGSAGGGGISGSAFRHGKLIFPLPAGTWQAGAIDMGWDLAAPAHTPLIAVEGGTVTYHADQGFSNGQPTVPHLQGDSGQGYYYGHAGPGLEVRPGNHVAAGAVIGEVGAGIVGISTGPHLEFGFLPFGGMGAGAAAKQALGYDRGGFAGMLRAAKGYLAPKTTKPKTPVSKPRKKAQAHPKGNTHGAKINVPASVADLTDIPGYAELIQGPLDDAAAIGDNQSTGLTGALAALGQLSTSASGGTGPAAAGYLLNESDAADIQPYLANLAGMGVPIGQLTAGMTYQQAYQVYKAGLRALQLDVAKNGTTSTNTAWGENLGNIQQVLDYVGSDPAHRIVGPADMGILGTAQLPKVGGKQLTWAGLGAPGKPLDLVEAGLDNSLISMYQRMIGQSGGLAARITHDLPVFTKRAANVLKLEQTELKRYQGVKKQIDALKVISARNSLAEAQHAASQADSAYSVTSRKADLHLSIAALGSEIADERTQPVANKAYLTDLAAQKAHLEQTLAQTTAISSTASAGKASGRASALITTRKIALEELLLRQQLPPIETELQRLGGSKTTAGTPSSGSSVYGTLQAYLTALGNGTQGIATNVTNARSGLPSRMVDLQTMQSNLGSIFDTTTFNPITAGSSSATDNSSLIAGLLTQENLLLSQGNAINAAVTATIQGIMPLLPAYEHGGPVAATGLALVHEGEYVTPNPRGPYGSSLGGQAPQVTVVIQGDMGPLMSVVRTEVDGRIQSPANLRVISAGIGARATAFRGAPGGFRQ